MHPKPIQAKNMDKSKLPYYPQYLQELKQVLTQNQDYRLSTFCVKKGISLRSFEYWLYRKQSLSMGKLRMMVSQGSSIEEAAVTSSAFSPMTIEKCSSSQTDAVQDRGTTESVSISMPNGVTVTLARISESALVDLLVSLIHS